MSDPNLPSHPYIIAIASQKGGVAKTTTAVSLGGALVTAHQEVLLLDLDSQANLTLALGIDPARVREAVSEVLFNSASLVSVSRETSIPGLDLVPANSGMELAERFLPVRKNYETILRNHLRPENHNPAVSSLRSGRSRLAYDFVVLDCPPSLGAVALNALAAADLTIIPTQPEYFSARALYPMVQLIRQVRSQYNPDLTYRILLTLVDRRNRIHCDVVSQIRAAFGERVFDTTIDVDTKIRESAVEGLPITHHKARSRSALQYEALAQELIHYVQETQPHNPVEFSTPYIRSAERSPSAL
jgi:chromosome partitioning protein